MPSEVLTMPRCCVRTLALLVVLRGVAFVNGEEARVAESVQGEAAATIDVERGHPWRPPYGLDRVGQPLMAVVEISDPPQPLPTYTLVSRRANRELARIPLELTGKPPYRSRIPLDRWPTELILMASVGGGEAMDVARRDVDMPTLEADACAQADRPKNPVDLGTILVPGGWLLLAAGDTATIRGAALTRLENVPAARVTAWFESAPSRRRSVDLAWAADRRTPFQLVAPPCPESTLQDRLHVEISTATGEKLWEKVIPTMVVREPPSWPVFGAVATKLRYDAPISVRADDNTYSELDYEQAWDEHLQDVVVALPNGSRFVFWRGSSYVPFWAGRHNTGLSYEWAETSPPADGYTDCVEPLMDKQLRYGRVQIVESTCARVHVRWSYQSCDFQYKVWGDSAVEDYYFYPDGFGTRVVTLQSVPTGDYELSEFIILTPQATYPLSVLPANLVDVLFLDGEKRELLFPFFAEEQGAKIQSRGMAAIYRVRMHKEEPLTAVYFNPRQLHLPSAIFAPFFDQGQLVTSTYWGSHWPLARGKTTGSAIDDRVHFSPCHNSVMSWARQRPEPISVTRLNTLDTLGRAQEMLVQTWAWLIGMSDGDDKTLLQWAHGFAEPPSLEVEGARLEAESYVPQRRAIRMVVESDVVTVTIEPKSVCVNPVFELCSALPSLIRIELAGRPLDTQDYAWDGLTLWINATLEQAATLQLEFASEAPR